MEYIAERDKWSAALSFRPDGTPTLQSDETLEGTLLSSQKFVVFQAAHKSTDIKSHDGKPWIRIVGFSPSLDAARVLARTAHDDGGGIETRIMPTGRNFLIGAVKYDGLDLPRRAEEQQKSNAMIDAAIADRKQKNLQIQQEAADKAPRPRKEEDSKQVELEAAMDTTQDSVIWKAEDHTETEKKQKTLANEGSLLIPAVKPPPVPFLQKICALAVVPDADEKSCEPSVIALFAMEHETEMKEAVARSSKTQDLIHLNIFVGPTGVWLPLTETAAEKVLHHNTLRQNLEDSIKFEGGNRVVH